MTDELIPRSQRGTLKQEPRSYGQSIMGSPLQVWLPTDSDDPPERLIFAGIHGDEIETTVALSAALRSLPPEAVRVAVVLAANPDGLTRGTRCNANGVDLNRNFPTADWNLDDIVYRWSLDSPRDVELSAGDKPASEPETRALMALIAELKPTSVVALHAPLACIDDPSRTPLGSWLAEQTDLDRVLDVGYPTPGSFGRWASERDLEVITYELPPVGFDTLAKRHVPVLTELLARDGP